MNRSGAARQQPAPMQGDGNSFSRNSRLSQTNFCARNCCVGRTDRHLMGSPKPRLRVGAFFICTPRIVRALAGWGSSSTRAQSPPHSVWRDREAAVPSMLSLILWRLSNALVHAKAGSRADSYYFGNRSLEARLWLTVARRCEFLISVSFGRVEMIVGPTVRQSASGR